MLLGRRPARPATQLTTTRSYGAAPVNTRSITVRRHQPSQVWAWLLLPVRRKCHRLVWSPRESRRGGFQSPDAPRSGRDGPHLRATAGRSEPRQDRLRVRSALHPDVSSDIRRHPAPLPPAAPRRARHDPAPGDRPERHLHLDSMSASRAWARSADVSGDRRGVPHHLSTARAAGTGPNLLHDDLDPVRQRYSDRRAQPAAEVGPAAGYPAPTDTQPKHSPTISRVPSRVRCLSWALGCEFDTPSVFGVRFIAAGTSAVMLASYVWQGTNRVRPVKPTREVAP